MPSNLLTEVKANVAKRMEELRPAYLEYLELEAYAELTGKFQSPTEELEAAQAALDAEPSQVVTPAAAVEAAPKVAATRARPGSAKKPAAKKKPAARKTAAKAKPAAGDGQTEAKVLEIVGKHQETGIKVGEIIAEGNLSQSYTYDVVKRLTDSKQLVKRNRRIYLHQNALTSAPKTGQAQPQAAAA